MIRFFTILSVVAGCATIACASDEILKQGLPGTYSRLQGMEAVTISLRINGSYVITFQDCLSAVERTGRWSVSDGTVILNGRGHPEERQKKLTRFLVVPSSGNLALRPLDDFIEYDEKDADFYLFRYEKKQG